MPLSRRRVLAAAAGLLAAPHVLRADLPADADVAVVGAGVAGLAAAAQLGAAGRRVVVLEARDRIGGRAFTDTAALGLPFDRGAHWLHSAGVNPFRADAARLGRQTWESASEDLRLLREGRPAGAELARFGAAFASLEARAWEQGRGADFALADAARGEMETVAARLYALSMATDAGRLSVHDFNALEGGADHVVEGGLGRLVADLWAGVAVETGHAVDRIDWRDAGRVTLSGAFGTLSARRAIITAPPPVLAAGAIRFDPALPADLAEAVASLRGGDFVKVGLRLDRALTEVPEYVLDLATALREETALLHLDRRQPLATVMFAGSHAAALGRAAAAALEAAGREAFAAALGAAVAGQVRAATVADWSADPFARGSYTVADIGRSDARATYARPVADRLFLAGDSAAGPHAITVAGARAAGEAAAAAILRLPG